MDFDLTVWKERASDGFRDLGGWLRQQATGDASYLVYGALCGMSLWPLVEAAQGGESPSVWMTLGGIAGGIGRSLIAKQIQDWKNRVDERLVAEWVVEEAPNNPDLRESLDDILEKLDAVTQTRQGLPEDDREWFTKTLRDEMARLGNLQRFEGVLVHGDVYGDIVTSTKTTMFDQRGQRVGRQTNVPGDWPSSGRRRESGD